MAIGAPMYEFPTKLLGPLQIPAPPTTSMPTAASASPCALQFLGTTRQAAWRAAAPGNRQDRGVAHKV